MPWNVLSEGLELEPGPLSLSQELHLQSPHPPTHFSSLHVGTSVDLRNELPNSGLFLSFSC
jgi:hypothetical protein